eukprot:6334936-Prymnesium_polylepis.1
MAPSPTGVERSPFSTRTLPFMMRNMSSLTTPSWRICRAEHAESARRLARQRAGPPEQKLQGIELWA